MRAKETIFRLSLALVIIVPVGMIALLFLPRALPWWGDGGDWLKRVNAILGNSYPMWEQTTFQYPPIFFVLVAGLSQILGEVLSLKVLAIAAYGLIPLSTYFFVKELLHDRITALISALLAGFTPIWVEMIGWGGYPDLLGLALIPFAFYGILRFRASGSSKNLAILAAGSVLIPFTHHLTTITFIGTLVIWGVLSVKFDRQALKGIAISLGVGVAATLGARLIAGPFQFLTYNSAALTYLQTNGDTLLYMFKSWFLFGLLYATAIGSAVLLLVEKEHRYKAILLISWTAFPLLATQGYLFGIALDYNRMLFFFAQPLMVFAAVPIIYLTKAWAFLGTKFAAAPTVDRPGRTPFTRSRAIKQGLALVMVALSVLAVVQTAMAGSSTITNVNSWYNSRNIDPYGDQFSLDAVNYIHHNTSPTSVIVAEYPIGRWVEGIAQRRVLLELDPRYLFITGEVEREIAARSILGSAYGIRNGYAWILDQSPYGSYAPIVSMFLQGEYTNMAFVNDSMSTVTWKNALTGGTYTSSLSNSTQTSVAWVENDAGNATLAVTYHVGPVAVTRSESLSPTSGDVNLFYQASSSDPSVILKDVLISVGSWPGSGAMSAALISNGTLLEQTSVGPLYIFSTSFSAFPFYFSAKGPSAAVDGRITFWTGQAGNGTYLSAYDRASIVKQYAVSEVVIPNTGAFVVPVGTTVSTQKFVRSTDLYQNLLNDPSFKVAYFNNEVIVLQVVS